MTPRDELVAIFQTALDRVHAGRAVERALSEFALGELELGEFESNASHWSVIAAGKAAAAMAAGAARVLGTRVRQGLVVTRAGHGDAVPGFDRIDAGHPIPDEQSVAAAELALERAGQLGPDDALLFLLSGGASALLTAPVPGVTLEDKRRLTESLLRSDVDIAGINAVRRQLSRIKGGGLARAAAPARVVTLAVSDVRGDRPEVIGSGPTIADPSARDRRGPADALEVLRGAGLLDGLPSAVRSHLERSREPEPAPTSGQYRVIARLEDALEAAQSAGEARGLRVRGLGAILDTGVDEAARRLAHELSLARRDGIDLIVAGGEPTVNVHGDGKGGRAQQTALALTLLAEGRYAALVAGTDGSDGPTDAAGAVVTSELTSEPKTRREAARALERNDAYPFLGAAGALLLTGPTATNVNDLALVRVFS